MSTFTRTHNACFRAELQKTRRTALPWLCLGATLFIPLIQTLAGLFLDIGHRENAWESFLEGALTSFAGFFYPLFLVIMIGRLVYLEHRSDTWKLLETQPVSRTALFLVKFELTALIAFLCLLLVLGFAAGGAAIVHAARPSLGFAGSSVDGGVLARGLFRLWITSLGLIALQYYLALLIRNFAGPMTIGLIGIIAAGIMTGFGIWSWWPYNALSLTSSAFKGSPTGQLLLHHEWLSLLWAAGFLLLAYQLWRQRGFGAAHLRGRRGLVTGAGLAAFAALVWLVSRPQQMAPYPGTVIAGRFTTTKPVTQVALLDPGFGDTIVLAPAPGGRFRMPLGGDLAPGLYVLAGGGQSVQVFFGSHDSLHVDLTALKDEYKVVFSGTRAAESEFLSKTQQPDFSTITRFAYDMGPATFLSNLREEIVGQEKAAARFHTTDNIGVRPDFLAFYRRGLQVAALRELELEYPKTFALYHPNEELKWPRSADNLRRAISFSDPSLLRVPGFLEYATDYLRAQASRVPNRDSAFAELSETVLQHRGLREAVYLRFARERLARLHDSALRARFLQAAFTSISNPAYQHRLRSDLARLNALMRGRPAPDFAAQTVKGNSFSLGNFSGRYVLLDVWATWCGPCKRESPAFEEIAERYTDDRLLFAAISVDEDKNAWKREAQFKFGRVLQLHVENAAVRFLPPYGIRSIPRFILIDPRGRIVNANMPPPSEPEFTTILQQEVFQTGSY